MNKPGFLVAPIGYVRISNGNTRIEIHKDFTPALEGLEGFSHIIVVFWCHLTDTREDRSQIVCDKPYTKGPDRMGIFATRSESRPNPIAITPVQVIKLDTSTGVIHTPFIDAVDETPIIDIKPYHPCIDRIKEVSTPEWCDHWPKYYEDSASFDWESEFNF